MNKSWLTEKVRAEQIKEIDSAKKNPQPENFLFRVWIKDKYRWDLWQDDVKIVVAIPEKDAALK